jgi:hypothetical protein
MIVHLEEVSLQNQATDTENFGEYMGVAGQYEATSCRSCSTLCWAMETGEDPFIHANQETQIRMTMAYAEVTHHFLFVIPCFTSLCVALT